MGTEQNPKESFAEGFRRQILEEQKVREEHFLPQLKADLEREIEALRAIMSRGGITPMQQEGKIFDILFEIEKIEMRIKMFNANSSVRPFLGEKDNKLAETNALQKLSELKDSLT